LQGKSRKLVALVGKAHLVIGIVCHVLADDNTGEFDPFFIGRIKNTLSMMIDKSFMEILEDDFKLNNSFSAHKEENKGEILKS
jgi:hypothetical protein